MKNISKNGCAYGQVTRQITEDINNNIIEIKESIKELSTKMDENYNHISNRLPLWVTTLITILGSTFAGIIVFLLSK
jgi:tetrahydromethanopterin S-methyltransferase subunit B